jgi:hypothetical protein
VQLKTTGHRGCKHNPLYSIKTAAALRRRAPVAGRMGPAAGGLDAGDDGQQIALTWIAAQDLRRIYHAKTREEAERRYYRLLVHCAEADAPSCTDWPAPSTLARTAAVSKWASVPPATASPKR